MNLTSNNEPEAENASKTITTFHVIKIRARFIHSCSKAVGGGTFTVLNPFIATVAEFNAVAEDEVLKPWHDSAPSLYPSGERLSVLFVMH